MLRLCAVLFLLGVAAVPATAADGPPNVVLIISDDQAWTDYGFMGHPQIETPHLDRLAKESVCFPRGYVPDSLCRPSLLTILTGLYPHQHGVVGNDPPPPADIASLGKAAQRRDPRYLKIRQDYLSHVDKVDTLAEMLGRGGYRSHQSGKWWEGSYQRAGFDEGMTHGDRTRDGRHGDKGLEIGRKTMQPVFDFLKRTSASEQPFFVYYAPFLPHTPHNPPERILKKYAPGGGNRFASKSPSIRKYYAMCEWFDETCGRLIDKVEELDETDNTIFVYCCDNGWITEPDSSRYAPRSKRSQYEGGTRTPIFVKAPGVAPRMMTDALASTIDIVPTVLKATGQPVPESLPGIDLLDPVAVEDRRAIYGEIFEHDIRSMDDPAASLRFRWMIEGGWKLIVPHRPLEPDAPVELFNLALDPTETRNLADEEPERVTRMTAMLDAWWNPGE